MAFSRSYTYDQANRPLTKTGGLSWSWYPAGNLKTATDLGGPTTYLYDNLNRLHQVNEPTGRKTLFAYDIFGRRTDTWYNTGSDIAYLLNAVIAPSNFAAHTKATYDAAGHQAMGRGEDRRSQRIHRARWTSTSIAREDAPNETTSPDPDS